MASQLGRLRERAWALAEFLRKRNGWDRGLETRCEAEGRVESRPSPRGPSWHVQKAREEEKTRRGEVSTGAHARPCEQEAGAPAARS